MKYLNLAIALSLLLLSGCASKVVDWDGDNIPIEEQHRMMNQSSVEYTEDIVTLATENHVAIIASRTNPTLTFQNDYEIKQDNWSVDAHNISDKDQCVAIQWKLMDFKFVSEHPTLFYVPKRGIAHVGIMTQMVWEMQGVRFVPDSSGFIWAMGTRDTVPNAAEGDECTFLLEEEDLRKEEDVYVH